MKPKSKLEHAMLALAAKLPPITEKQRLYAFDYCFKPRAVVKPRKHEIRCLCCGQTAVYDKVFIDSVLRNDQYDCPYCGRTMDAERNSPDTKWRESKIFVVLTTFRGHQVARAWEVSRGNYSNDNFARYDIDEIFQIWITPEGKEVITGRNLQRSFYSTTWDFISPLGIRRHNGGATGYIDFDDIYDIAGYTLYPDVRVLPIIKRNGWHKRLLRFQNAIAMTDAMRWLLTVPEAEMLVKTGQDDLFLNMVRRNMQQLPYRHAVCIANRNGYYVNDAQMWLDMLAMADELGKDTHNPKVVCPANLKAAHDALLAPAAKYRTKHAKEQKALEALKWESHYQQAKAPYLDICLSTDNVKIAVIPSVADIKEEGEKMHHCVFDANYYKKDDSLILSARAPAGDRLETVEFSLKTFKVIQSRARCNGISEHHNEIVALVEEHAALFRERKRKYLKSQQKQGNKILKAV